MSKIKVNRNNSRFYSEVEKLNERKDISQSEYEMELKKIICDYLRNNLGFEPWYIIDVKIK